MDDRNKWIERAEAYKRRTGTEMVTILRNGIYDNWPVAVFDKCGDPEDVVYRTDREIEPKEDAPRMTVTEYAANLYERRELP